MRRPGSRSPSSRSITDALRSCALTLGCPVAYLERSNGAVHYRRGPHGDGAIHTFWRGAHGVVSLPPRDRLAITVGSSDVSALLAATRRGTAAGTIIELVDGLQLAVDEDPVTMSIADAASLPAHVIAATPLIDNPSAFALDDLRSVVSPEEWRRAGAHIPGARRVGALSGGALVAVATVEPSEGRLARVRAIVAPTHRRKGFGHLVLHELSCRVIHAGQLPYARLALDQEAEVSLAGVAGFVPFARSLTFRVAAQSTHLALISTKP